MNTTTSTPGGPGARGRYLSPSRTVLVANPSADLYGSDRMLLEAVRGLVEHDWRAFVTCSIDGPLAAKMRAAGAEVVIQPAPVVRKSILSLKGMVGFVAETVMRLPRMVRLINAVGPDVVLANTVTIPAWTAAARLCRRPVVVYVHEAEETMSGAARGILTAPLRLASGVVFNSETSRRVSGSAWLEKHDRVRVVPNGVQGPPRVAAARESLKAPFHIAYVGRLSPRKGVDLVVKAAARLRESGIEPHVELVGAVFPGYEWYEGELRELIGRLDLTAHVRFSGFQTEVWNHIAAADVTVLPSRLDESFGNVLIESLRSQRPVVAADHTGLREAADGFGSAVLVDRDDVPALEAGLRRIHDHWNVYRERSIDDAARAGDLYGTSSFHRRMSEALAERTRSRSSRARRARSASRVLRGRLELGTDT